MINPHNKVEIPPSTLLTTWLLLSEPGKKPGKFKDCSALCGTFLASFTALKLSCLGKYQEHAGTDYEATLRTF